MRVIWKGTISFGLVSIPISLYPAIRREELKFRMLRGKDLSPVNYKRVAATDGKEVEWDEIVKGYEYEKGKFVVLKPEDFQRVDIEATQTVDIISFVELAEISPLLFNKPYFMEAGKGGDKAYVLLLESLKKSKKIALAKVVIKTRQHLAAVKPVEDGLMLELMHFPDELVDISEFKRPADRKIAPREMKMAEQLIESMTEPWDPENFSDDYRDAVVKMIEEKIESGSVSEGGEAKPRAASGKIIDLVSVLQESLDQRSDKKSAPRKSKAKSAPGGKSKTPARSTTKKKPASRRSASAGRKKAA